MNYCAEAWGAYPDKEGLSGAVWSTNNGEYQGLFGKLTLTIRGFSAS